MKVNNLFKFKRHFSIDILLSESELRNLFVEKYINTKKTKFKGKIENDTLLLWTDKIIIKVPAFEILEIKCKNADNTKLLNGKVKLTKLAKFIFLLAFGLVLIAFFIHIFQNGFKLESVLVTFGIIAGGLIVIHSGLNNAKYDFLSELNQML